MKRGSLSIIATVLTASILLPGAESDSTRTRLRNLGDPKKDRNVQEKALFVDGVDVEKLSYDDLEGLLDADDEKLTGELDIWTGKRSLQEKQRKKRILPVIAAAIARKVAWRAARYLFKSVIKRTLPKITKSGKRLTKSYFKRGGYRSAKKDFKRFKPTDIKGFTGKNGQKGMTGKVLDGKYTITVRRSSTYGRPTLEIRKKGGNVVRKFRYENSRSYQANKKNYRFKTVSGSRGRETFRRGGRRKYGLYRYRSGRGFRQGGRRRSGFSRRRIGRIVRRGRRRRYGFSRYRRGRIVRRSRRRRYGFSRYRRGRIVRRGGRRKYGFSRRRGGRIVRRGRRRRSGFSRRRRGRIVRRGRRRRSGFSRRRGGRVFRRGGRRRSGSTRSRSRGGRRSRSFRSRRRGGGRRGGRRGGGRRSRSRGGGRRGGGRRGGGRRSRSRGGGRRWG